MVQTYQSPVRIYKFPFELVMAAYERRFPTCHLIPAFLSSDILRDEWLEDMSRHDVVRRCKLSVDAPYLLKKIVGVDYAWFIQQNVLDRRNRRLEINSYNESFSYRIDIVENCTYTVHPEHSDWTCFEQSASLDVKSFFGFENSVEKLAMKQYSANIAKGKEIIEYYINELKQEGITYIPPYMDPVNPGEDLHTDSEECRYRARAGSSESCGSGQLQPCTSGENKFKLDADYIARYLGKLNPLEESRLIQLQQCMAELLKGKVPCDTTLLRFLRAREFQVDKAREMLSASLIWKKKYQVDRILSEYQCPVVIKEYFPGGWHHQDKEGRPLYLLRLGQMDVKGLIKSVGEEGLLKLTLQVCEEGLKRTEEATRDLGKPILTWTLLVDLEGLNMRHLWRPGIKALLRIIEIVEDNYPETLSLVMIIRAPRVFPILWTIVSTFINEHTRSKVLFYAGNDYQEEPGGLLEYIPTDFLPDFLEGSCQTSLVEGGLVPKSLYLSEEDQEKEREHPPLFDDSIYNSVSLAKGQVHEVVILNEDRGSVICWDFDVMKQDLAFSVYRTKVPITATNAPATPSGALQTIQNINPLSIDPEHRSVLEKQWKEGSDYFQVEPMVICHDGESIQGSHVTGHVGTYILQWRFHESAHSHYIMDSITQHKAKLMYYYETLSSSDYKGSMSSLRSSQSGFSSNTSKSMNSSCPSR